MSLISDIDFIIVDVLKILWIQATYEWRDKPVPWSHHHPSHVRLLIVSSPLHRERQHGRWCLRSWIHMLSLFIMLGEAQRVEGHLLPQGWKNFQGQHSSWTWHSPNGLSSTASGRLIYLRLQRKNPLRSNSCEQPAQMIFWGECMTLGTSQTWTRRSSLSSKLRRSPSELSTKLFTCKTCGQWYKRLTRMCEHSLAVSLARQSCTSLSVPYF